MLSLNDEVVVWRVRWYWWRSWRNGDTLSVEQPQFYLHC